MKIFSIKQSGFTLIELLVVIAILGILSSVILALFSGVRDQAKLARSIQDLAVMRNALEIYASRNSGYPPDVIRGVPPGIEQYIERGEWPEPAFEGAIFDWENWDLPGGEKVYQLSIRFCDFTGSGGFECNIPDTEWAEDFDEYSSVYHCIAGPCRSHQDWPIDHPGYCVNCGEN